MGAATHFRRNRAISSTLPLELFRGWLWDRRKTRRLPIRVRRPARPSLIALVANLLAVDLHAEPDLPLRGVQVVEEASHAWSHGQRALVPRELPGHLP